MPRRSPDIRVTMDGWLGGLNKEVPASRLELNELASSLNFDIGLTGELTRRRGYEEWADPVGSKYMSHLIPFRNSAGTDWLITVDTTGELGSFLEAGTTYTDSGWNWLPTTAQPVSMPIAHAVANGELYISQREASSTIKWNDGNEQAVAGVPRCSFMEWRFEQLFCANVNGAPSQLQISGYLTPEDFTTEPAAFDVDADDGYEIRGMAPIGDSLFLFKDHAIYNFTGRVKPDFQLYKIDSLRGTYSPRTIKQVRGQLIFFDRDTGVWSWDGASFRLISEKINRYLLDGVYWTYTYLAHAAVWGDKYVLSVPWGTTSTYNNRTFVYSTLNDTWTEYDYGILDSAWYSPLGADMVGMPQGHDGVYYGHKGNLDKDQGIAADMRTSWLLPGGPHTKSRLRNMAIQGQATDDRPNVYVHKDFRWIDHPVGRVDDAVWPPEPNLEYPLNHGLNESVYDAVEFDDKTVEPFPTVPDIDEAGVITRDGEYTWRIKGKDFGEYAESYLFQIEATGAGADPNQEPMTIEQIDALFSVRSLTHTTAETQPLQASYPWGGG